MNKFIVMKHTAKKLLIFYQDPQNEKIVSKSLKKMCRYDTELWQHIFVHFFSDKPINPKSANARVEEGCADPKWDILLHEMLGLDAHTFVLKLFERRKKSKLMNKKAA